jgi:DNA (cytosine-5)-methyltransferase 1
MTGLVLSLFPGIGLLDMAFEEAGFCIVRGPDLLWGGDIRRFHPPAGRFDGVIGGPPCQQFSPLRNINIAQGNHIAPDLIPEFERCITEAQPSWFLMENVPAAPGPEIAGYQNRVALIRDVWCGGKTMRYRKFHFGTPSGIHLQSKIDFVALHTTEPEPTVTTTAGGRRAVVVRDESGRVRGKQGDSDYHRLRPQKFSHARRLQGLPEHFDLPPFTERAKLKAVGNGVPLAMGRAVAQAVVRAVSESRIAA